MKFGCSLTLAGYGYPFTPGARTAIATLEVKGKFGASVWWNRSHPRFGWQPAHHRCHRIADVIALARPNSMPPYATAYANIAKIRVAVRLLSDGCWPDSLASGNSLIAFDIPAPMHQGLWSAGTTKRITKHTHNGCPLSHPDGRGSEGRGLSAAVLQRPPYFPFNTLAFSSKIAARAGWFENLKLRAS